ncbi:uncharacterized protein FFB14_08501 [Fusarium fujikuroi]|nr:uncharacterized protein FFB14_08501 [Fusarium fujikuroi]
MASAIKIFAVLMAVKVKLLWLGNSVLKGGKGIIISFMNILPL